MSDRFAITLRGRDRVLLGLAVLTLLFGATLRGASAHALYENWCRLPTRRMSVSGRPLVRLLPDFWAPR